MGSEEQKLNEWFNGEKAKGLVDFKVEMNAKDLTREEICRDINKAIAATKHATRINWKELDGI
jgi:hypothetical protein